MKILAINGSHRKGKNTATMLKVLLAEATAGGAETELLELKDYQIKPCQACNKCLIEPRCAITDDDMSLIAEKMLAADGIVLGSPVYWGNVSTLMKNFMDRTRWLHMCRNMLAGKVGAAVTHAGLRNGGQELAMLVMEHFLKAQGLLLVDGRAVDEPIYAGGAMGTMFDSINERGVVWKKSVQEDVLAIRFCRQLGRNMVELIQRLDR